MLLFKSMLRLFLGKLKSTWIRPFFLKHVFQRGEVDPKNRKGARLEVNKQRIKMYLENIKSVK